MDDEGSYSSDPTAWEAAVKVHFTEKGFGACLPCDLRDDLSSSVLIKAFLTLSNILTVD